MWEWLIGSGQPGLGGAGIWSRLCWTWVNPLIAKGWADTLEEGDARPLVPPRDEAEPLAAAFDAKYEEVLKARAARRGGSPAWLNATTETLLRLYWWDLVYHSIWVLVETACRLLSPVALREFLRWLQRDAAHAEKGDQWRGWMWAIAVLAGGGSITLVHHVFFWVGMRLGFVMRQQVVSAIHSKVLRLNSASVSYASTGHVVNLASNDVRRFDDAMPFWVYVWSAPLETALVLVMVALELGWGPAAAGVAAMLAVMPLQAILVQFVGGLRRSAATRADERVRLTGEVISGALAMKMLGWEDPFADAIRGIRRKEVSFSGRMAQIRALNLALQFSMTPVVAFITFATYRALNGHFTNVPSVFYALSLLNLPKLTMVYFFVLGVQFLAELKVSLSRIDAFLSMPEPPPPTHQRGAGAVAKAAKPERAASGAAAELAAAAGADGAGNRAAAAAAEGPATAERAQSPWRRSLDVLLKRQQPAAGAASNGVVAADDDGAGSVPLGGLRLGGADYDWGRNVEQMGLGPKKSSGSGGGGGSADGAGGVSSDEYEDEEEEGGCEDGEGGAAGPVDGGVEGDAVLSGVEGRRSAAAGAGAAAADASAGKSNGGGATPSAGSRKSRPRRRRCTLEGVRLEVAPGELLGISGEVGAGKSSVLAALLGELQPMRAPDGSVKGGPVVRGRVAYCAQIPWIVAGSLRDNILFGQPMDEPRYKAVLAACALEQDLRELPAGDETELGERGVNLSGGQKARVALARAAYSGADVVLLDDPLSAVDPRVGRILFDKCIGPGGIMAGRTRVLVTHQRQFLPRADRVAVLRGGRLVAIGAWAEVSALQLPELVAGAAEGVEITQDDLEPPPAAAEEAAENGGGRAPETGRGEEQGEQAPLPPPPEGAVAVALPLSRRAGSGGPGAGAEDKDAGAAPGPELERIRTMAPDVNRRPADSGRPAGDGPAAAGDAGLLSRRGSLGRSLRALSRAFSDLPGRAGSRAAHLHRRASFAGGGAWRGVFRLFGAPDEEGKPAARGASSVAGPAPSAGQLVKAENREVGGVSWRVYARYAARAGPAASALVALLLLGGQAVSLASDWWLSLWAYAPPRLQLRARYIWVYGLLVALVMAVSLLRASLFFAASIRGATNMHDAMVTRVLRAPLSFFHTTPVGRILNRFSNDLGRVDDQLPLALFDALQIGCMVLGALVLMSIAVPVVLPVFVPLLVAFFLLRRRYIVTSREVKRLEAITRSPVYASFSATLKGLPTIRAYGAQKRFHDSFLKLLTLNGSWWYAFLGTSRWVGFRLDLISTATLAAGVFLAMAIRDRISAAILALALTYVLQLTGMLQWWVRQTAEVENTMTSVERMLEYTELPQEPPRLKEGGAAPPPGWPSSGALVYTDVWASYRPGLPPVLRKLSFSLPGGCSCGIVGRTGSGKSSLMLTLFRLISVDQGTILLDGLDTSSVALDVLRRQLAIIPQDPVLFSGTLRSNLDPWNRYDDADLWEVLGAVQLKPAISGAGGLAAPMAEAGDNLSVGQRQLFCLARALLQDAKVLALDEATANVDRATDALIQTALRDFAHGARRLRGSGSGGGEGSGGRVLLVIAHRIDTILDTDQLLVLSNGSLAEAGPPGELARRPGGVFSSMVESARAAAAAAAAGGGEGAEGAGGAAGGGDSARA